MIRTGSLNGYLAARGKSTLWFQARSLSRQASRSFLSSLRSHCSTSAARINKNMLDSAGTYDPSAPGCKITSDSPSNRQTSETSSAR